VTAFQALTHLALHLPRCLSHRRLLQSLDLRRQSLLSPFVCTQQLLLLRRLLLLLLLLLIAAPLLRLYVLLFLLLLAIVICCTSPFASCSARGCRRCEEIGVSAEATPSNQST
jgi:hypothetical protein